MKKILFSLGLILVSQVVTVHAAPSENFQFAQAFIESMDLYKQSDARIWPEALTATTTERMDPYEMLKPYRAGLYRLSLEDLDKTNRLLALYVENKNLSISEGAKSFLSVTQLARTMYEATMKMVENTSVDKDAAVAIIAKDNNEGRYKRIELLIIASAFLNKVLNTVEGKLPITESERVQLLKLIDEKFPNAKDATFENSKMSMDNSLIFIRPLLAKNKGTPVKKSK